MLDIYFTYPDSICREGLVLIKGVESRVLRSTQRMTRLKVDTFVYTHVHKVHHNADGHIIIIIAILVSLNKLNTFSKALISVGRLHLERFSY